MHAGTKPVVEKANQRFRVTSDSNVGSSAQRKGGKLEMGGNMPCSRRRAFSRGKQAPRTPPD